MATPQVIESTVATAHVPTSWGVGTWEDSIVLTIPGFVRGVIDCDGPGNLLVAFSEDGVTGSDARTIRNGESLSIDKMRLHTIKIDATVNATAYRVLLQGV